MNDSAVQDLQTAFPYGNITAKLTLDGPGMEERPEMLANIFSYVSKGVYKSLLPKLIASLKDKELPSGEDTVEEQLKIELFDCTLTLHVKLDLNVELDGVNKEALRFSVIAAIGTIVAEDAVFRIASRLQGEAIDTYYKEHPEEASPFAGVPRGLLNAMLGEAFDEAFSPAGSAGGGSYPSLVAERQLRIAPKHERGVAALTQVVTPPRAHSFTFSFLPVCLSFSLYNLRSCKVIHL